jgi:2-haloacid dehalogenase
MKYRWLLFDADGTLFDYDQAEAAALQGALQAAGVRVDVCTLEAYRRINLQIWRAFERGMVTAEALRVERFAQLFTEVDIPLDPEPFSGVYLQHLARQSRLLDGAHETLEALRGIYRLALITNGLQDVQRPRLAGSALRDHFEAVIISEEVGAAKPDTAIFTAAFQRMGNPPKSQVLMIGDSLTSDIRGANAYGIDACWFNPARKPLEDGLTVAYTIGRLPELLEIL